MKIYNPNQAIIPKRKITEYLLSNTHPVGKSKAKYFEQYGFSAESWEIMADALSVFVNENEISSIQNTNFGERYVIDGNLQSPDERNPLIRTIWVLENNVPIFITAFPL